MLGFYPLAAHPLADDGPQGSKYVVEGVVGTGSAGSVTVSGGANALATGSAGIGEVGRLGEKANVTGSSATGAVGDVTVSASALAAVTGSSATGFIGNASTFGSAIASITGMAGSGEVGSVLVLTWGTPTINPATYATIEPTGGVWTDVSPGAGTFALVAPLGSTEYNSATPSGTAIWLPAFAT